ncbi:inositol-tetrakisphosphate 1-kinase [Stylonychia lemnae]|uniref:Inositol-tetrakisphosphate 1-kinase n=1 Tax=Stylonychia lemnae TaxID=5949 RepID=A0A078AWA3_STYLE|nr:inositol-tetrakisphosphate 1-kinase [Stylonychia lemnae]|eukprot:CDW86356.1 inositol-tetrakisphosphate 1-kinase [Stylonychia lemnae]
MQTFGFNIDELFDCFITSGEVGFRKPDPQILQFILDRYPQVQNHEIVYIGDSLAKDILCAHRAGIRSIFMSYCPSNVKQNYQSLASGIIPDFTIVDMRSLPSIFKIMDDDVAFIQSLGDPQIIKSYRDILQQLPSQNRMRVGLLQDGDGVNRNDQFHKTGLLFEESDMQFIPMNLDDPFELNGRLDVMINKGQDIIADYYTEEGSKKAERLRNYINQHKMVVIDSLEGAMKLQSRKTFLTMVGEMINEIKQQNPGHLICEKLKQANFFCLKNDFQDQESVFEQYKEQAALQELKYPIIVKILQASRNSYSHNFYAVSSDAGLRESLAYKGFKDEILIFQELLKHQEVFHKLYIIGEVYDVAVKRSIPHLLVTSGDYFFFQTKMKFDQSSYQTFEKINSFEDQYVSIIAKALVEKYELQLIGADILIEEDTGDLYIIDVNYFSSYEDLTDEKVRNSFKDLIRKLNYQNKISQQ